MSGNGSARHPVSQLGSATLCPFPRRSEKKDPSPEEDETGRSMDLEGTNGVGGGRGAYQVTTDEVVRVGTSAAEEVNNRVGCGIAGWAERESGKPDSRERCAGRFVVKITKGFLQGRGLGSCCAE